MIGDERMYTVKEVSDTYGVSVETIRKLIRERKIRAVRFGGWRIAESDLDKFIAENRIGPNV